MAQRGKLTEVPITEAKPTDLLSVDEVAAMIGVTRSRVSQLLISGEMKGDKLRGILWQIERREAERFMNQPAGRGRPRSGRGKKV